MHDAPLGVHRQGPDLMKDMLAHLDKLRADAAECQLISDLATDLKKRELFARLAAHLRVLAKEVEAAISGRPTLD